jgi:hypothetical protein
MFESLQCPRSASVGWILIEGASKIEVGFRVSACVPKLPFLGQSISEELFSSSLEARHFQVNRLHAVCVIAARCGFVQALVILAACGDVRRERTVVTTRFTIDTLARKAAVIDEVRSPVSLEGGVHLGRPLADRESDGDSPLPDERRADVERPEGKWHTYRHTGWPAPGKEIRALASHCEQKKKNGGVDETRTRDLRRDRPRKT